jgi:septal ring factor EnvC (AmiA/AmiB activator)
MDEVKAVEIASQFTVENLFLTGGVGGAVLLFTRAVYINWLKGRPEAASAAAVESQFKALREQIEAQSRQLAAQQIELTEMRRELNRMDSRVHHTQSKLTRTEMLTRQSFNLHRQHGTNVPQFMLDELEDLMKTDPRDSGSDFQDSKLF